MNIKDSSAYVSDLINSSNANAKDPTSITSAFSSFSLNDVKGLFLVY